MLKTFVLILMVGGWADTFAQQTTFNKIFPHDSLPYGFGNSVLEYNNNNVIVGSYWYGPNLQDAIFINAIDSTGETTKCKKFNPDSDTVVYGLGYGGSSFIDSLGSVYLGGSKIIYSASTQANIQGIIIKVDSNSNEQWIKIHTSDSLLQYKYLHLGKERVMYAVGEQFITSQINTSNVVVVKMDMDANIIWRVLIGEQNAYDVAWYSAATPDSGILVGVRSTRPLQGNAQFGNFYKLSKDGDIEWIRTNRPNGEFNKTAGVNFCTKDGGYFIQYSENYATFNPSMDTSAFIFYKTDNELNPVWSLYLQVDSGYDFYRDVYRAYENADTSIMLCGQMNYSNNGWVRKMSKDGVQQWDGVYRPHSFNLTDRFFYLADIKQTDDGGWICTGTAFDSILRQSVWILKLDSNGCVENTCPQIIWDDVTYFLPDVTPVVRVYPNPASYQIQIETEHIPSNVPVTFSMYNIMGQSVLAISLTNTNSGIDIQHLHPGLYLWQLADERGNIIATNKIVVQ